MKVAKLFVAVKAFITNERGEVLVIREASTYKDGTQTGKYDVVGGRIEPGQQFDESLIREAKEETGLDVKIGQPFFVNESRPVVRGEQWQIVRIFFKCTTTSTKIVLSEDHDGYKWIKPESYKEENLIENLYPGFYLYASQNN